MSRVCTCMCHQKAEAGVLETVANTEQYAGYISQALVSDSVETGQNTRNITVSRKNLGVCAFTSTNINVTQAQFHIL